MILRMDETTGKGTGRRERIEGWRGCILFLSNVHVFDLQFLLYFLDLSKASCHSLSPMLLCLFLVPVSSPLLQWFRWFDVVPQNNCLAAKSCL